MLSGALRTPAKRFVGFCLCSGEGDFEKKILFLASFSRFEFSMAIRLHVLEFDVVVNLHQESGAYIWVLRI